MTEAGCLPRNTTGNFLLLGLESGENAKQDHCLYLNGMETVSVNLHGETVCWNLLDHISGTISFGVVANWTETNRNFKVKQIIVLLGRI